MCLGCGRLRCQVRHTWLKQESANFRLHYDRCDDIEITTADVIYVNIAVPLAEVHPEWASQLLSLQTKIVVSASWR